MGKFDLFIVGNRVRELREAKNLTQEELAKKLGVTRSTLAKWETGWQDFKTEHVIKIANSLDVDCNLLLRGIPSEKTNINETTGLSGSAIENIERNHSKNDVDSKVISESINMILESDYEVHIKHIAEEIMDYITVKAINQDNACLPKDVWISENLDIEYRAYQLSLKFMELIKTIGNDKINQKRALNFFIYNDYSLLTSNHYKRITDVFDKFEKKELTNNESSDLKYEIVTISKNRVERAFKKPKTKKDNKNDS